MRNILIRGRFFLFLLITLLPYIMLVANSKSINDKTSAALTSSLFEQAEEEKKEFHYKAAIDCYEKILTINQYDKKAAQEIEKLHELKENYNKETYQETKARMLLSVNQAWNETNVITHKLPSSLSFEKNVEPVLKVTETDKVKGTTACRKGVYKRELEEVSTGTTGQFTASVDYKDRFLEHPCNKEITTKLDSLIIPCINLENASIEEAVDYLKQKSCEYDPLKKGINIFLRLPPSGATNSTLPLITLQLNEIPMHVALEYLAREANLTMKIDPYAVALYSPEVFHDLLIVKEYEVPPHFFPPKEKDNKEIVTEPSEQKKQTCYSAREYFQSQGIELSPEACATYFPSSGKLIVRANQENLDLIETLVLAAKKNRPFQVSIETKFIEVSEDKLKQLGLNWLLSPTQIGSSGLYASGEGSTLPSYQHNTLVAKTLISANSAIANNPINSSISNGTQESDTSSSGTFNICGIYNTQQLQLIIKALQQKKGVDIMAAPHVTTRSGLKATVKIVDEFIYPTQYTPPQLPQSTTNSGSLLNQPPPTIAPAFPNSWATKNLGVILEAKPTIEPDAATINLELHPQIVDFDGFINYGTPINTIGYHFSLTNSSMVPFSSTLTTNTINQPVFTIREVTTSVKVSDGQTIILGGLIHEDIQKTKDKIPLLGDIPLAGRLFQSKGEKKLKKNLIIFVTPKILRP